MLKIGYEYPRRVTARPRVSVRSIVAELVLRTPTIASPRNSDTDVVGTRLQSVQHILTLLFYTTNNYFCVLFIISIN